MILTTEFSLMSPVWVVVNTCALLQTLAFMSEPIRAADGEEGLNNVPLLQNEKNSGREFCRVTHARKESGPDARSTAIFRNPRASFVITFMPQP